MFWKQKQDDSPSAFQHKAWISSPRSVLLETSSPWARRMDRVLALVTVAARFSVGELASSSGDTGTGKLLWLNRLSRNGSADIALVPRVSQSCRLHDCHRGQSEIRQRVRWIFTLLVKFELARQARLSYLPRCAHTVCSTVRLP